MQRFGNKWGTDRFIYRSLNFHLPFFFSSVMERPTKSQDFLFLFGMKHDFLVYKQIYFDYTQRESW